MSDPKTTGYPDEVERLAENLMAAHRAGDGDEDLPAAVDLMRAQVAEIERMRAGLREIAGTFGIQGDGAYFRNRAQSILDGDPNV
jgi:hypothetical protein